MLFSLLSNHHLNIFATSELIDFQYITFKWPFKRYSFIWIIDIRLHCTSFWASFNHTIVVCFRNINNTSKFKLDLVHRILHLHGKIKRRKKTAEKKFHPFLQEFFFLFFFFLRWYICTQLSTAIRAWNVRYYFSLSLSPSRSLNICWCKKKNNKIK